MVGTGLLGLALFLTGGLVMRVPAQGSVPPRGPVQMEMELENGWIAFEENEGISLDQLRWQQYRFLDQGILGGFSEFSTQRPALFGEREKILGQSA